ncbi:MAG: DUF4242 domain-containing protein [Propionicimonas sp.]|nr:DUF4242 domain-containing protein [Propionicimonas sp.]
MPIFMVERHFAEDLEPTADEAVRINEINDEEGVQWLVSFLSADKRRTYCLYEAESIEAILRAAERAGIPADAVVEVTNRIMPDGSLTGVV